MKKLKLIEFKKVKDGRYLKNYELKYINKAGNEKTYEIVSRRELSGADDLGDKPSGVSIIATCNNKLLLLHEFRMGINQTIYNLCAGMLEPNETIETCIERELYEETGLKLKRILKILPPSFAAAAISDVTTYIAFVEVEGTFNDHTSDNEMIHPGFYTKEQIEELLANEKFSSRAQLAAYYFTLNR